MNDPADAESVRAYARSQPTFGGMYYDRNVIVALFITDIDEHAGRIRSLLRAPDQFRVALAERTYADVEASNLRVRSKLQGLHGEFPQITNYGIGMIDGQFAIKVGAENLTPELASDIEDALAPEQVRVVPGVRAHRA